MSIVATPSALLRGAEQASSILSPNSAAARYCRDGLDVSKLEWLLNLLTEVDQGTALLESTAQSVIGDRTLLRVTEERPAMTAEVGATYGFAVSPDRRPLIEVSRLVGFNALHVLGYAGPRCHPDVIVPSNSDELPPRQAIAQRAELEQLLAAAVDHAEMAVVNF